MTDEEIAKEAAEKAEAAKKAAEGTGVEMSQERLDELLNASFSRGAANGDTAKKLEEAVAAQKASETAITELNEKLEQLKKTAKKGTGTGDGADDLARSAAVVEELTLKLEGITGEYEAKLVALTDRTTAAETAGKESDAKLRNETLRNDVIRAAADQRAVAPDEVFILMKETGVFKEDSDGNWQVVNPTTGQPRIDVTAEGAPLLSVDAAVEEYLNQRTHMVQPSGRTGSGQGAGSGQAGDESNTGGLPALPEGVDPDNILPSQFTQYRKEIMAFVAAGGKPKFGGTHNQAVSA